VVLFYKLRKEGEKEEEEEIHGLKGGGRNEWCVLVTLLIC